MSGRDSFLDQLNFWGTLFLANLFWIVISIPLVTLPLATAGLFQVMSKQVRGKQPEVFQDFFGAMRRYWAGAYVIGLLDVLGGGVILVNLRILAVMGKINEIGVMSLSATVLAGLVLLLLNLYIWPLLVIADLPVPGIIKMAFQLLVAHPLWSLGVLIAAGIPFLAAFVMPAWAMLLGAPSLSVWIASWGAWHVIMRHPSEDEPSLYP